MVPRMNRMTHTISRRSLLLSGAASLGLAACSINSTSEAADAENADNEEQYADSEWRRLTNDDWRARLSAAAYGVAKGDLIPGVELALSAMTAHAQLQQAGYTVNPF